jgi:YfiH family protein
MTTSSPSSPPRNVALQLLVSGALARAGFSHGFTTRLGGVSPPPFETLDFAVLRDPERLAENQTRLATALGVELNALHQSMQVHGSTLVVAGGDPKATLALEADALAAEPGSGHAVAVRVADCVPVLLADPTSGRVAAVHAGWRGVEAGVVVTGVRHLEHGAGAGSARDFIAAIGPHIGPCCFEVGDDVAERIAAVSSSDVIARHVGQKAFVDLRRAVRIQLEKLGLGGESIDDVPGPGSEGCTRCNPERFYSYRRDGDSSGRLIGAIVAR